MKVENRTYKKMMTMLLLGGICSTLAMAERKPIDITFDKPKVIDVFDKPKAKRLSADKVCKYPNSKRAYAILGDALVGEWTAINYAGYANAAGMSMPLPADMTPVTGNKIYMMDGELVLSHPPEIQDMTLTFAKDKNWNLDQKKYTNIIKGKDKKVTASISKEDAEALVDCKLEDLPHFIGKTTFKMQGSVMHATYRFVVLTNDILYGLMEYSGKAGGYPYSAKRAFAMTRDD